MVQIKNINIQSLPNPFIFYFPCTSPLVLLHFDIVHFGLLSVAQMICRQRATNIQNPAEWLFKCRKRNMFYSRLTSTNTDTSVTGSESFPNRACSSGCHYLHTETCRGDVWKLLIIMPSVTNHRRPASPQDTQVQTYGCGDNFRGIHRYKQPLSPLSPVRCADLSTAAGTICVRYYTRWTA